ncbi:amino acid adenylation domain-containing protein [Streptomyces sp. NPDC051940]|uniref:non-ribosomal peptide synthetase n=1 Tax=Streptomyces sp. NPDC051940 TaxID=3155675 RepID=UPI00343E0F3D
MAARTGDGGMPLSFPQRRLWFLDQMTPGDPAYNCAFAYRLSGPVDPRVLSAALQRVIRRHEALRTVFRTVAGQPVQVVLPEVPVRVSVDEVAGESTDQALAAARAIAEQEALRGFDLATGPLLRVRLLRLGPSDWVLLVTVHHIVVDGWSMQILFTELERCYDAELTHSDPELDDLSLQYSDFAAWQHARVDDGTLEAQLDYWKDRLSGLAQLDLPADRPRPSIDGPDGDECVVEVPEQLGRRLRGFCQDAGATPFMGLMAGLKVLLARYSGSTDIAIGAPSHGRLRPELEQLIGFFINTLVIRTSLEQTPSFRELLLRVRENCLGAYQNQELPFDRLVDEIRPAGMRGTEPLIRVLMQTTTRTDVLPRLAGVTAQRWDITGQTAKFDLLLDFREHGDGYRGFVQYRTDLFDRSRIEAMLRHYVQLLDGLLAKPDADVFSVPMLSREEHTRAVGDWNRTAAEFPAHETLHGLFERQADRSPNHAALVAGDRTVTYAELEREANQVADQLRSTGVRRGDRVGLLLERSPELAAGMLGILKADAAYVPLDPGYPAERLALMVQDGQLSAVVTRRSLAALLPPVRPALVHVEDSPTASAERVGGTAGPNDLAYLIFTSGSTGRPKGTLLDHRGRVGNVWDLNRRYGVGPGDRLFAISSPSFDMCVYDTFGTLAAGGTVVLPGPDEVRDPARWLQALRDQRVTVWQSVPALLGLVADEAERAGLQLPDLRVVLLGGDWIPVSLPDRIRRIAPDATVVSLGGATELSIHSTVYTIGAVDAEWLSVPYGTPMDNQLAYVLERGGLPAPVGVPGELFLGGVGMGWGYHSRPALTAERYVPNPFSGVPGDRMYRTGDLARYGADGMLELLGRADLQVKVHGVRIELGEIEAALRSLPGVGEAVVAARGTGDERRLVGYVVPEPGQEPTSSRLRELLAEYLPATMVPASVRVLPTLPITPNGKVDRRSLPDPDEPSAGPAAPGACSPQEQKVAEIWCRLLGRTGIGPDDNFFDLGGDSFRAVRAVRECDATTPISTLFTHPTVRSFTARVSRPSGPRPLLVPLRDVPEPRLTVLGVPYGGGNAVCYSALAAALPQDIRFLALSLPGHDFTGEPLADLSVVVDQACAELGTPSEPVVLYGQCVGSAITVALARRLAEAGRPPRAVFIGGSLVNPEPLGSLERDAAMSDGELASFLGELGGLEGDILPADRTDLVRVVRHDLEQSARWFGGCADTVTGVPAYCVIGDQDPATAGYRDRYADWARFFGSVELIELAGAGHYFIKTDAADLAAALVRQLTGEEF